MTAPETDGSPDSTNNAIEELWQRIRDLGGGGSGITKDAIAQALVTPGDPLRAAIETVGNATYATPKQIRSGAPALPRPGRPLVAFVFDDNPVQDMTVVKPILDAEGIKATFAVVSSYVNGANRLTWNQVRQLADEGHEINNHSATHAGLGALTDRQAILTEAIAPLDVFRAQGLNPTGFTYAGGSSNATARDIIREYHGYALGINGSSQVAGNAQPFKTYSLDRKSITNASTLASHTANVDTAIANNQFLIFYAHAGYDLDAAAQQKLVDLINYIQAANVPIVTVQQGLDLVGNVIDTGDYVGGASYTVVGGGGQLKVSDANPTVRTAGLNTITPDTQPYDFPLGTVTYASVNSVATGWPIAATADVITTRMASGSGAYVLQQYLTGSAIYMRRGVSAGTSWGAWKTIALA